MCYSAETEVDPQGYLDLNIPANIDIDTINYLIATRAEGAKITVPRGFDLWALRQGGALAEAVNQWRADELAKWQETLSASKARLETAMQKTTKTALKDRGIAERKIKQARRKIEGLETASPQSGDNRVFPGVFVPLLVRDGTENVVRLMRYQCRPARAPANYDRRFPGTYNARRDNLDAFWREQYLHSHGVLLADAFYENVERDGSNQVLRFTPRTGERMRIACLWSHWEKAGEQLDSFAAVTDDPEPEVAAAGHDRTVINLPARVLDQWLTVRDDAAAQALLDDKLHPYYEHEALAA